MARNVLTEVDAGIGIVSLNRAERHNAFDDATIAELGGALAAMAADAAVRVVVLSSKGKSFCAGADLAWMQRAAGYGVDENLTDARALAELLRLLAQLPKPTVARVQGPAYGGGVGLVAACDIAVASAKARFALTEVRLGLVPAVVAPYVVAAVGERQARRYMLSAGPFSAEEALRLGLVHELAADAEALDRAVGRIVDALLLAGPQALAECKALLGATAGRPLLPELIEDTAQRIARIRATDEAREGMTAFFERRKPNWHV